MAPHFSAAALDGKVISNHRGAQQRSYPEPQGPMAHCRQAITCPGAVLCPEGLQRNFARTAEDYEDQDWQKLSVPPPTPWSLSSRHLLQSPTHTLCCSSVAGPYTCTRCQKCEACSNAQLRPMGAPFRMAKQMVKTIASVDVWPTMNLAALRAQVITNLSTTWP